MLPGQYHMEMTMMEKEYQDIAQNIEKVREIIARSAEKSGRKPEDITLVAVTKTVEPERINAAIRCGITELGENRVQELLSKYDQIENREAVHFHLIGRLQTNKVKYIIDKVTLIHSVDSERLLLEIEKQAAKHNKVQDILLEINLSGEPQKGGMPPEDLEAALQLCSTLSHIRVLGLMTVPPVSDSLTKNSRYFQNLQQLFIDTRKKTYDNVHMSLLSMGMSADYDTAIESGSNMVRVGSAIFGKRK